MGLEFLHEYGAHRMRDDARRPLLLDNTSVSSEEEEEGESDLNYERSMEAWSPIDVREVSIPSPWPLSPCCFIDGKDLGRTVAWLQTSEGFPVPVRLSEIGAVVMCNRPEGLSREWCVVERVVSMVVDPFPWDEIERFALALQEQGFRLLPCQKPQGRLTFDFQEMRQVTQNRSLDEMLRLEKQALVSAIARPVLVDGTLASHSGGFDEETTAVVGMIKTPYRKYLHDAGWRVFYALQQGQRTPVFLLRQKPLDVISWYVRIDGTIADLPTWGIVRLEIPAAFFSQSQKNDWSYIDRLSRFICDYRCKDTSYQRASVSLYPIQRAEESLSSLFSGSDALIHLFYCLTHL